MATVAVVFTLLNTWYFVYTYHVVLVMLSNWIFHTFSALVYLAGHRFGSLHRHRTPGGRATAARPPHTAALLIGGPGEKEGAAVEHGEREAWEGALPRTACSIPMKGCDAREAIPSRDFFRVPVF